jgi:hypothetical protein
MSNFKKCQEAAACQILRSCGSCARGLSNFLAAGAGKLEKFSFIFIFPLLLYHIFILISNFKRS